jgi:threonine/homoserine/homoserine lactone efflux protein
LATESIHLPLILAAAFLATASPGPATLTIAGTSMASGRRLGLALASGVMTGSLVWSIGGALGLSALMYANVWVFETMRYLGAAYLLYLAFRSARSAVKPDPEGPKAMAVSSARKAYLKGLALHLTNPKAILFFGSLYSIGIPPTATAADLVTVIVAVGFQSFVILHGYALLFSSAAVARGYARMRRWFDASFALAFGYAGLKILTAKLR